MKVLSAFSPKMFTSEVTIKLRPSNLEEVVNHKEKLEPVAIGHPGTAHYLSKLLDKTVNVERKPITLKPGDKGYIVVPSGRLEPGQEYTNDELERVAQWYYFEIL